MRQRPLFWFTVSLVCLAAGIFLWRLGERQRLAEAAAHQQAADRAQSAAAPAKPAAPLPQPVPAAALTNSQTKSRYPYRLANTDRKFKQLLNDDHAIILGNALIDTTKPVNLAIPDRLRAPKDNGTYLVQSKGVTAASFRAALQNANAAVVSYIPNNAWLVRVSDGGAQELAANPLTQRVLPFEPYYKLDPSLLKAAMENTDYSAGLTLTLFADAKAATLDALNQMGAEVVSEDRTPFGPVLRVNAGVNAFIDVARLPGVQLVSPARERRAANDLMRPRLGVAADSVTSSNYNGLTGSNVVVNINDSGVDATHPDLAGRIFGDFASSLTDDNGHGTHVAGTILGRGIESSTVPPTPPGSVTNASFRGIATNAQAYVVGIGVFTGPNANQVAVVPDAYLQEQAALTNALISNNSWNYLNDPGYDIFAASYDAAVRDALPQVPGSQPVLFVFAAGDDGGGQDDGTGGSADTILSPASAKNVITVGAIEQLRNITNDVVIDGITNQAFLPPTDSTNQVASFSGRGNVGIEIEGPNGRFKPDVVAPGVFVISDRSSTWDMNAYYNPSNYSFNVIAGQSVATNSLDALSVGFPDNAVQLIITIVTNNLSPNPMPPLPIYLRQDDNPTLTTYDFLGTNSISLPPDLPLNAPGSWFYSIGNNSTNPVVNFDVLITIVTTNDTGTTLTVLSNLNSSLGTPPNFYYRYESGTSMSAAGVSGMLACMQEFYQGRLHLTNSPALMKALLINGARSVNQSYGSSPGTLLNLQGWGLATLSNSAPAALGTLTGGSGAPGQLPVQFFDQDPTNALATGDSKTRTLSLTAGGQAQDLHITLVWTDPPGNPAAGSKLVNDLDLIVTNLVTGDVFYGNDIPAGGGNIYNEPWDTNNPAPSDSVNNVENVVLQAPLDARYSITVAAKRVNVNAVTANTNDVVQDYALVIGSGDGGGVSNAFTFDPDVAIVSNVVASVQVMSNMVPVLNQRVGGNSQFSGSTNGEVGQWNFYIFTNTTPFTNVAFVTFMPPELGVPRMGVFQTANPQNATRVEADVDLYVSTFSSLTNLRPSTVASALKSTTRTGTEKVLITNSALNQVYYIGVKSEDQEGANYGFVAAATQAPFNQTDTNGNIVLTVLANFPLPIPDGSPSLPGQVTVLALTANPAQVRKVVVTNTVAHQRFGDLIGTFSHGQKFAVLNNHGSFVNPNDTQETFIYDDSGENDIPGSRTTDGPGSLRNFVGDSAAAGIWTLVMEDDSPTETGSEINFAVTVEPQTQTNGVTRTLAGNSWFYDFVDVPEGATNLTVSVTTTGTSPLELYVRRGDFPTFNLYDKSAVINPPGGSLTLTTFESPPLNPGRYYIGVFNPSITAETVTITWSIGVPVGGVTPVNFLSVGNEPILDDAVTYSTTHVGINSKVVSAEVGVRIDHPRESDLVLTLISPSGTRVLLAENRGGLDTNGYGAGYNITNVGPVFTRGAAAPATNSIPITIPSGTLLISYNFLNSPSDMRIYYGTTPIFDSGLVIGSSSFAVNFGPGAAANLVITMNEPGTNPSTNFVRWNYTATVLSSELTYATFTEDTNKTTLPIKFATPPFGAPPTLTPPVTVMTSGFEGIPALPATNYAFPSTVDGWTVADTNAVTVVTVPQFAAEGSNVLALHNGTLLRTLPTVAGQTYTLTFASHARPVDSPVAWWTADPNGSLSDSTANLNNIQPPASGLSLDINGEVGDAFNFDGTNNNVLVNASASLNVGTNGVGFSVEGWINPSAAKYGLEQSLLEWNDGSGFGDHFTISTPAGGGNPGGPGSIWGTLNDTNGNYYYLSSQPLVLTAGVFQHVAWTYDQALGQQSLYVNGRMVAQRTFRPRVTQTSYNVYLGLRPAGILNGLLFQGSMDEMTVYGNVLSQTQIQDIYAAGSAGKCLGCGVLANVIIDGTTNIIRRNDTWVTNTYTFTAATNGTLLELQGLGNGMLFDGFTLVQQPDLISTNFFLPEESLDAVVGENALGDWKLEILDNRAGPPATNPPTLVSWQLSLVTELVLPATTPLFHGIPVTNTVGTNGFVYFYVDVPLWAQFATNILSANGPVNLIFNQNFLPGTNLSDVTLTLTAPPTPGGTVTLSTNTATTPPLLPGQRYYLAVQNTGTVPETITMEVDFDITSLTNGIANTNTLAATSLPRYFQYDVTTNAQVVAFEILNPNGNVDLVARYGAPLPDQLNYDYISANPGTNNESIVVFTNSVPRALAPGRWYLGTFNNDLVPVTSAIRATEAGPPTIIILTNNVPFNFSSAPGVPLTNFFEFIITNTNSAALFELYNLSGNVDLTLDQNIIPYSPPFFSQSVNPGTNREQIVIRTNFLGTAINANWFLGVPNNDPTNVTYTIRAIVATNGILLSGIPIDLGEMLPPPGSTNGPTLTWQSVSGENYEIQYSTDLINWITITNVSGGFPTTTFTDPAPVPGNPIRFYRIIQIPVP